jgi:hypothetical protein
VQKFADPIVDNEEKFLKFVARAKRHPEDTAKLQRFMANQPDLIHGCLYPETDVDILTSLVLRFVNDNIFQKGVPGAPAYYGEVIAQIEGSMQLHVEPKRGEYMAGRFTSCVD